MREIVAHILHWLLLICISPLVAVACASNWLFVTERSD